MAADHGHPVAAIFLVDILDNRVTLLPSKVEIDIRRRISLGINESFKEEIVSNRIHVGDFKHVRDQAAGCRTSPHPSYVSASRILQDVVNHEEILAKAQPADHRQFLAQSFACFVCGVWKSFS